MKKPSNDFETFRRRLGQSIQKTRKVAGFSQEELGAKTGLDRVTIGYIEQGRRTPKLHSLFLIAKNLHVKVADFF